MPDHPLDQIVPKVRTPDPAPLVQVSNPLATKCNHLPPSPLSHGPVEINTLTLDRPGSHPAALINIASKLPAQETFARVRMATSSPAALAMATLARIAPGLNDLAATVFLGHLRPIQLKSIDPGALTEIMRNTAIMLLLAPPLAPIPRIGPGHLLLSPNSVNHLRRGLPAHSPHVTQILQLQARLPGARQNSALFVLVLSA